MTRQEVGRNEPAAAGFKMDKVAMAKECRQLLEPGKGKEVDPPLEPPERNTALLTP